MLRRVVRIGAIGSIVGISAAVGVCSYTNHEFNAIGVVRFGRCASTAVKIAVDYKWNLRNIDSNSDEYEERLSKIHLRSASRLKEVFCKNGGIFIKVGQHIGSLDYLLPEEYVKTMKTLHDKAPESEISELFETVEKDLKCKISDVFSEIEDKPIGTASLAQCHRAKLKDGTLVAVKIQHPSVKKNSNADIVTMLFLVKCLAKLFPEFRFVWLAEETQRNLPVELDFINEGRNIEKVAKMLSDYKFVKVPKVYWKYCSDRVLTMEFCEGIRVDDYKHMKDAGINLNKISERMGMIYSRMIFSHGFVHCDPHPGNVLVNPVGEKTKKTKDREFQIVLLDHGLYQSLTKAFRYNYANMWMALLEKDMEKLKKLSTYFNVEDFYGLFACIVTGRSWDAINKGINNTDFTQSESVHIKAEAAKYLREISSVLNRIPREMLLLLKTNDLLRGIESSLNTRNSSSSFIPMSKCCVKLINSYERETKREAYRDAKVFFNFDFFRLVKFDLFSYCREKFYLFKILTYEIFLYLVDFYPVSY